MAKSKRQRIEGKKEESNCASASDGSLKLDRCGSTDGNNDGNNDGKNQHSETTFLVIETTF